MSQSKPSHDVESLDERLDRLEEKVDTLLDAVDTDADDNTPPGLSHRDANVVEALDPGEVVSVRTLQQLYRERTDISRAETLRRHIRDLVEGPYFESHQRKAWRFLGVDE